MSDDAIGTITLVVIAAIVVFVWHRLRRRSARNTLSDEIMSGQYDQQTMTRAMVDAGGDNQKARQLYIKARLREHQRSSGKQAANTLFEGALALFGIYVILHLTYSVIWGDALWWLY